jgi:hypothetical protein
MIPTIQDVSGQTLRSVDTVPLQRCGSGGDGAS